MWLLWIAVVLGALKVLSYLQVVHWPVVYEMPWWWVLAAFAITAVWWWYADASGLSRRRAEARIEQRRLERQRKRAEALRRGDHRH